MLKSFIISLIVFILFWAFVFALIYIPNLGYISLAIAFFGLVWLFIHALLNVENDDYES